MPEENKKLTAKDTMTEFGASGLNRYSGAISEDFISDLDRASSRWKVYQEMRFNDPVVSAALFAVEQVLRHLEWLVEPSDEEDEEAMERADFVRECKDDMSASFGDFISECLTFLSFGFSFFEIVYKKRLGPKPNKYTDDPAKSKYNDGKVGWRKFAARSQDSLDKWDFDEHGGVQGMYQRPAPTFEQKYIPIEKALLFRTKVEKNNPEGRAVLRSVYRPWFFKKNIEVIMGIGIERNLNGMPVVWLPEGFTTTDYNKGREIAERVRVDEFHGLVIPGPQAGKEKADQNVGWDFELATGGSRLPMDLVGVLEYYDRRIAMAVLAQFLMLGSTVGSWALSKDQSDLFLMTLEGWANMIADTLNRHAVPKLMRLNGWDEEKSPSIVPSPLSRANLAEMAQWIKVMFEVGFNLGDMEDHLRAMADLPPKEEEATEGGEEEGGVLPEAGPEQEEEVEMSKQDEEVEMSKQDEEVWHLRGSVPDDVEEGWEFSEEDLQEIAEDLQRLVSEP